MMYAVKLAYLQDLIIRNVVVAIQGEGTQQKVEIRQHVFESSSKKSRSSMLHFLLETFLLPFFQNHHSLQC